MSDLYPHAFAYLHFGNNHDESTLNTYEVQESDTKIGEVYLGKESDLQGWIPLPFNVIEEDIVPLVRNNIVEETADIEGFQFTSSAETSINGWKLVDADVVTSKIEPIVESNRLD